MIVNVSRRALLGLGTAALVGTAGCSGRDDADDSADSGTDADADARSDDDDGSGSLDCDITYRHEQGRAEPIETSAANTDDSCGLEAARAAVDHVEQQLDTEFDSSWGRASYRGRPGEEYGEANVSLHAIRNVDGDFVECPPLSFDEVADVTPAEVTLTIPDEDGADEECTHEIYVDQSIEQEE